MIKRLHTNRGFTIVETLVAVTILMIAVAGPLVVANKAYRAAFEARNQTIAYNLAQEYIEAFKNWEDNDIDAFNTISSLEGSDFLLDLSTNGYGSPQRCDTNCSGMVLEATGIGYTNDPIQDPNVVFKRSAHVIDLRDDYSGQALIKVTVSWNTGLVDNQIQLYSFITNASR